MTYSVKQKRAHLKITHVRVFHDVFNRKRTSLFLATCSTEDQIEGSNDSNKTCCEFLFMFIRCDVESLFIRCACLEAVWFRCVNRSWNWILKSKHICLSMCCYGERPLHAQTMTVISVHAQTMTVMSVHVDVRLYIYWSFVYDCYICVHAQTMTVNGVCASKRWPSTALRVPGREPGFGGDQVH